MNKPKDAKVYRETWCEGNCPHLQFIGEEYTGYYFCSALQEELPYYDGPLALCENYELGD